MITKWDELNTAYAPYTPKEKVRIVSFELIDGRIEVVKRYSPEADYTPSPPDRIEKEIYAALKDPSYLYSGAIRSNAEIALLKTIKGKITSGYFVDEQIEFEEA